MLALFPVGILYLCRNGCKHSLELRKDIHLLQKRMHGLSVKRKWRPSAPTCWSFHYSNILCGIYYRYWAINIKASVPASLILLLSVLNVSVSYKFLSCVNPFEFPIQKVIALNSDRKQFCRSLIQLNTSECHAIIINVHTLYTCK